MLMNAACKHWRVVSGSIIIACFTAVDDGSQTNKNKILEPGVRITHLDFYQVLAAGCKLKKVLSVSLCCNV